MTTKRYICRTACRHGLDGLLIVYRNSVRIGEVLILTLLLAGCDWGPAEIAAKEAAQDPSFQQWKLPGELRELSGLALTSDERLLGVTDESAIIYEIDYERGQLVKAFAFGEPALRGDFEGIAVLDDVVWLMTSNGHLFRAPEGSDGEHVSFQKFDTGLGAYCELEGLAQDSVNGVLVLACKETRAKSDRLKLFELSVADDGVNIVSEIVLPIKAIANMIDSKHVNPSGVAIEAKSGRRIMVAARQRAIFQLSGDGELIDAIILPKKKRHRQAEGIEVTNDGRLLIADEGGDGKARLAIYRIAPSGIIKTE